MARRGDGIYLRGKTWWLDFTHRGDRHVARLGKNISRTVAGELARLAMAGVDPRTIQELGGWASLEMVERYTHLSPTHKAEAVELIAQNSPTVFTTAPEPRTLVRRKTAKSLHAPVAQVDRAAVS